VDPGYAAWTSASTDAVDGASVRSAREWVRRTQRQIPRSAAANQGYWRAKPAMSVWKIATVGRPSLRALRSP
jgi:hypothetical protein